MQGALDAREGYKALARGGGMPVRITLSEEPVRACSTARFYSN
jgi:hypothetical protein